MRRVMSLTVAAAALAVFSAGAMAAPSKPAAEMAPVSATPPGVTLQQARIGAAPAGGGGGMRGGGPTTAVYADAMGKTLYTFDKDTVPGKSACYDDCAKAWPAAIAPANAVAAGDWSIITRDDGAKQWALGGKPLYTFVKDTNLGEAKGHNMMELWRTAAFNPTAGIAFPEGITAEELVNAPGWALVNARRMTLYTLDGDMAGAKSACAGTCLEAWLPLTAPAVANKIGEFAPVNRADGIRQWAYKGRPLYTYAGDAEPGDVIGDGKDKKWRTAMVTRYFNPANVTITTSPRHGAMFVTAGGMTLYARDANKFSGGGASHADRSVARGTPATGRVIGIKGCEGECTATWTPFKAGAGDNPSGYWTISTRDDGTRQWAYLGYPLYTYTQDTPGAARGHDIYDLDGKLPSAGEAPQTAGAQALYWRVALP